jgi:hypothetical protein
LGIDGRKKEEGYTKVKGKVNTRQLKIKSLETTTILVALFLSSFSISIALVHTITA